VTPQPFTIVSNQTAHVDVDMDIDTGIQTERSYKVEELESYKAVTFLNRFRGARLRTRVKKKDASIDTRVTGTENHELSLIKSMKKILTVFFCIGLSAVVHAQSTTITKNTPGFIKKATDLGAFDPSSVITVTAWLNLHNETQLDGLVKGQYQKGSSIYHKWITQDQFNADYGPTADEVVAVKNFLTGQGLTVIAVAENNAYVKVQGTVGAIQNAFHVQIDNYSLKGKNYRSNKSDPSVNGAAGKYIAAITGLDDFDFRPTIVWPSGPDGAPFPARPLSTRNPNGLFFEGQAFRAPETDTFTGGGHTATYMGNRYGANITNTMLGHLPPQGYSPSEVRTAYSLDAVYAAGFDGTGETIVITDAFGSSTIAQDAALFSLVYGLPPVDLTIVKAPGIVNNPHGPAIGWDGETTLDVEWAHAIAPGAKIVLVLATDRASLDEAVNYAVVHHLGNTISNSWSNVEGLGNPARFNRDNRILQMAAAEGIDANFASGDFGDESPEVGFVSVDFPASSPFATGIGGTSLALTPTNGILFQTGWGTNLTRIADRVPLGSPPVVPPLKVLGDPSFDPNIFLGFQFGAGGGTSGVFAQPSFQQGFVPNTGMRMVPDISWLADPFTGVEIIQTIGGTTFVEVIGGTSLATPMFSALMAIAAEKAGHGLGQAAPLVYGLPAGAVLDITPVGSATNVMGSIDGNPQTADSLASPLGKTTTYYSALYNSPFSTRWFVITFGTDTSLTTNAGWDNVTGVGTPNGLNFINAIAP
jgi:subtilase family serine protease